jgi:peroxiredoxin
MDSAWGKIKRYQKEDQSEKADSVQRMYAPQFFQYYQKHPTSKTGQDAAVSAFMMWGNTGAAAKVKRAITHVRKDSKLWSLVLPLIGDAYQQKNYVELLERLKEDLTHPWSKSEVRMELADYHMSENKTQKAMELYREVVNIEAHPRYVEMALGNLHEMESLHVEQQAPTFKATTVRGDTIALSDLRGNVVLLEFWATWCGPCKPDIPHLKKVWSRYRDEDFQLIGVSLDESTEKLKRFVKERNLSWFQVQQEEKWGGQISQLYNVRGIPRTYLIDREGQIVAKDFREEEIEKEVRRVMESSEK